MALPGKSPLNLVLGAGNVSFLTSNLFSYVSPY